MNDILADIETHLALEMISYASSKHNSPEYRLIISLFTPIFHEHSFDATCEYNHISLNNDIKEVERELTHKKNIYARSNNWHYFLNMIKKDDFMWSLRWSFTDKNTIDLSNWDNLSYKTFLEYIDEAFDQIKVLKSVCLDFLKNEKYLTLIELFKY